MMMKPTISSTTTAMTTPIKRTTSSFSNGSSHNATTDQQRDDPYHHRHNRMTSSTTTRTVRKQSSSSELHPHEIVVDPSIVFDPSPSPPSEHPTVLPILSAPSMECIPQPKSENQSSWLYRLYQRNSIRGQQHIIHSGEELFQAASRQASNPYVSYIYFRHVILIGIYCLFVVCSVVLLFPMFFFTFVTDVTDSLHDYYYGFFEWFVTNT
jgi:hypothetical protein